jgi:ABC-type Mn2+/Zn2+ transport system ATPase subunit
MDVDVRPIARLRESPAAQATLGPIVTALCSSTADLSRVRVACDWIQYRNNFREPVTCRVDHDMSLVSACCDTVAVLDFGKLIAAGPTAQVLRDERVIRAYLGTAEVR